jgi:hypothetical protein
MNEDAYESGKYSSIVTEKIKKQNVCQSVARNHKAYFDVQRDPYENAV